MTWRIILLIGVRLLVQKFQWSERLFELGKPRAPPSLRPLVVICSKWQPLVPEQCQKYKVNLRKHVFFSESSCIQYDHLFKLNKLPLSLPAFRSFFFNSFWLLRKGLVSDFKRNLRKYSPMYLTSDFFSGQTVLPQKDRDYLINCPETISFLCSCLVGFQHGIVIGHVNEHRS